MEVTGKITLEEIRAGDSVASRGDRRICCTGGKVTKANRVTLELEAEYMGRPMQLKLRRDDLRGEVRVLRDGKLYSTEFTEPKTI